jgi:hypothetical protein
VSKRCGDSIVGLDASGNLEECDDGDEGSDACTAACQTRDEPAVPNTTKIDRYLGSGRHPVSGLDRGFITTYVEFPKDEPSVGAALFNVWGQRQKQLTLSDGASPIEQSNPVAAALPSGEYAVAWTDFNTDTSDLAIALRKVNADGSLGPLGVANATGEFTQQNPDILWDGKELVLAWEDYTDPVNGYLIETARGPRTEMLKLERELCGNESRPAQ